MPDLEDITYSRTTTIAAISNYYTFLTSMYMKESQVIHPPAGGWPSIVNADPAILQTLGKSDEVLSLLAHLPCIRSPGNWNADVVPDCSFADWPRLIEQLNDPMRSTTGHKLRIITEGLFLRTWPCPMPSA